MKRPEAVVLAGGFGTRLRPVIGNHPKSMAVVAGKPFLEYLLHWLRKQDIREVVLCVGYRWQEVQEALGDGASMGIHLEYSVEDSVLGTAGALKNAEGFFKGTFLALNGDSYIDMKLSEMIEFHYRKQAIVTLALVPMDDASRYGTVKLDAKGRIRAFEEKQRGGAHGGLINAGIYVLEPTILSRIPAGRQVSIEREIFPALVAEHASIYGFPVQGYFVDIGTPEAYFRSQNELSEQL
jgi:NDP-sugar pyrophosphorylase family protein